MNNQFFNKEVQRFSIRKYSFGAASVLLGCFLFGITNVSADENSTATISTATEIMASHYEKTMTSNSENSTNNNSVVDRNNSDTTSVIDNTQSKNEEKAATIQTKPVENVSISKNEVLSSTSTPNDSVESKNNSTTTSMLSTKVKETDDSNKDISSSTTSSIQKKDIRISKDDSLVDENSGEIKEMVTKPTFTPKIVRHALVINNGSVIGDDYPAAWRNNPNQADTWGYATGNCTSFVANRLHNINHFEVPRALGNGGQWGNSARRLGYRVDNVPARGSVAYYNDGSYGHVAWVADVSGNNVVIEEYNWARANGTFDYSYHTRTQPISAYTGYIHFKDLAGGSTPSEPTKPNTGGTLPSSGTYHFTDRRGVKAEPKISSPDLAYYDNGYSVTYDKTLIADNYEWISYVSYSGNRRYIAINKIATPTTPVVKGTINIQNKNDQAGTFDVVITNVSSNSGLKEVQVPTWSTQNGQDDIIWYRATKQNDGTYKVSVRASDHKNYQGEYNIHLYYVQNDGKLVGVTGTKTDVHFVVKPAIPDKGVYTFTGRASIKAEPKTSSPELAYYDAGNTVNYDKVLFADGHYWISYLSFSGNRRYISIV